MADKPLDFAPGSRASYSNTGYLILGRIIEVTSHESYHQYRLEHLLKPAGMTQSYIVPDEVSLATMARGYRRVNGKLEPGLTIHESYSGSAGDIVSTVEDVEKWNEALVSGKVVAKSDYALMMTPQVATGGRTPGTALDCSSTRSTTSLASGIPAAVSGSPQPIFTFRGKSFESLC